MKPSNYSVLSSFFHASIVIRFGDRLVIEANNAIAIVAAVAVVAMLT
jgi:hypothetical protein